MPQGLSIPGQNGPRQSLRNSGLDWDRRRGCVRQHLASFARSIPCAGKWYAARTRSRDCFRYLALREAGESFQTFTALHAKEYGAERDSGWVVPPPASARSGIFEHLGLQEQ